jgi:Protein of unknown function (DUF4256)
LIFQECFFKSQLKDMATKNSKIVTSQQQEEILTLLKTRFNKNSNRHKNFNWSDVEAKLIADPEKIWSLYQMEETGGEPDIIDFDSTTNEYHFYDCAIESPKGRRSFCYDREALNSRKEFKPVNSAIDKAKEMGIELLTEEQYRKLQEFGNFDTKTSSWIQTPSKIRKLGGAIFADFRYDTVFVYHNGAESYYAVRGFRGVLKV